ncbi:MAG: porin family protein [Niastella sp.]|uniref:porin family protein n=1 Tax=Niastella sp. TaxID=1869183 RepID=UPI00389ACACE
MKLKILLIALTASLLALGATAQNTSFGVRAGVNFTNINGKNGAGNDLDGKLKTGFNAGINAEIPIAEDLYVKPGLLFSTKGAKDKNWDKVKYQLSYIEVPVNLLYKPELGDGKLLLGIGPYAAFAVGGSYTDPTGNKKDFEFAHDVTAAEASTPHMKRMDYGGNLLAGYEFSSGLSFQLNAQLGLADIHSEVQGVGDKAKYKNTGFGVSVGYRFH